MESPEGDLLRVNVRYKNGPQFMVYKLVWFSKNSVWEQVMSLGDVALFLGNHRFLLQRLIFPAAKQPMGLRLGDAAQILYISPITNVDMHIF